VDGPHYEANVWNEVLTIWGEEGRVEITLPQNVYLNKPARVRLFEAKSGADTLLPEVYGWAFARELEHFAECVRQGTSFRTEAADAIRDLAIAETAGVAAAGKVALPARIDYSRAEVAP
jgi:predicted dehydrogenase